MTRRQRTLAEAQKIFPGVTADEWAATLQTAIRFGKTYTTEAGNFYCETLDRLKCERQERENPA